MKTILLTVAMLVASNSAHAIVSDKFRCQIEITEKGTGGSVKQDLDFFLARLPLSRSPGKDIRISSASAEGRTELNNSHSIMTANLTFDYQ